MPKNFITVRQDIWDAAFTVLIPNHAEAQARVLASEIVDRFSRGRHRVVGTYPVKPEVRGEIRKLLLSHRMGKVKIGKQIGVGTSTVQRLADELVAEGLLPPVRRRPRSG